MTYVFPQDLVLRELFRRFEVVGYDTVFATRSTKEYKANMTKLIYSLDTFSLVLSLNGLLKSVLVDQANVLGFNRSTSTRIPTRGVNQPFKKHRV